MQDRLLNYYKAIEAASIQMLEAARMEDWDGVVRCEGACAVLIEQLRFKSKTHDLPREDRAEKARVMQRILRNDAEIRILAEPWLTQFQQLFESKLMVH
ncbi:MAG: flagellar protein FliT [Gammaproteobacteria bacterium]|nr:flagellar protein FliT [Gammaproteobacteria bacterium]MBU1441521.1 flagellar protein FliT [Gammaproteobacteria bacterium]MBU2288342.1 flagellar protein FliT [Gammaproteobacteria bacterium]MBU2410250.1 flagellar protein FliT [Gammaproteobacteria bacterium]